MHVMYGICRNDARGSELRWTRQVEAGPIDEAIAGVYGSPYSCTAQAQPLTAHSLRVAKTSAPSQARAGEQGTEVVNWSVRLNEGLRLSGVIADAVVTDALVIMTDAKSLYDSAHSVFQCWHRLGAKHQNRVQ